MSERQPLPDSVVAQRVIPVARGLDERTAHGLADALEDGGLHVLEVTVEGDGGVGAIAALADHRLTVGAGTVTTLSQARDAVAAGAEFLVAPHFDESVADWALRSGTPFIPGGLTPTELWTAWRSGASAVKLFPASVGGPGLVRALLGPYPDLRIIPTGGITADNAADYLDSGAVAVGVGGWLTSQQDRDIVTKRAAQLVRQVV